MDYKPGLLAASIFKQKKTPSDAVLRDLFSKQKSEKTVKKSQKEEATNGSGGDALKEIANTTAGKHNKKIGSKRKHEDSTTTPTKSKKVKKDSSAAGQKSGKNEDTTVAPKKSKKAKADSAQNPDSFPFVHESLAKKSSQQQNAKKKKKVLNNDDDDETGPWPPRRKRRDKTTDSRTIFIGNCPLSADKKAMTRIFKEYGLIETVRFRCGPTARLELPKKAVVIKKEFHQKAKSYVSFVVFQDEESAKKALEKNGHVIDGHHLRVDLASNQNQHDKKNSIFVGNLPFTVTEEDLRSHFEDCGDILNIRVVRDRQTSIGKGIAFIQFDSKDGVVLAQKLNETEFQERPLRVMRCNSKMKPKTEDKPSTTKNNPRMTNNKAKSKPVTFKGKAKDYYSRSEPRSEKHRPNFAPTNKSKKTFSDLFEAKIERRVNKRKQKKKAGPNKADGLSAIFGDIPADMKKLQMDNPKFKSKKPKDKKKEKMKAKKKLKKAE